MRYYTVEEGPRDVPPREHPHATYLDALLFLVKRSNGYRASERRAWVYAYDGRDHYPVKCYSGQNYPTAEDVVSAVRFPERVRSFSIPADGKDFLPSNPQDTEAKGEK